jgi:16S rRNA (cytosine967-C5)-methyltransferase
MAKVTEARRAAAGVLQAVSRGRRLDLAFDAAAGSLPERERRWIQEASFGVVRFRGRLDHLLDLHLKKGVSSLSPLLLNLLRLGAYQLLYMDGVPPYAAISQTVAQVRRVAGSRGGGLATGVLRALEGEGGGAERFPAFEMDPLGHLTTWESHPSWLVRRWLDRWSPEEVRELVRCNNTPPPVFLRPLRHSVPEARALLEAQGMSASEVEEGVPCLELGDGIKPAKGLEVVPGVIQDPGAALVTVYSDAPPQTLVADLCAAPGGKALALAATGTYVLAADRSLKRLRALKENRARVGGRVDPVVALAQAPPLRGAPFVLLDVPCSGTGTLRRHPDARWRMTPDTMRQLVQVQREILDGGARLVPAGGHLVYSTCTLEPEENEERVEEFLMQNPEFAMDETGAVTASYLDERGCLSVLPQSSGYDGAFAARMVRRS